jgi:RNA exonuclease 4
VASYLQPLTGLSKSSLEANGIPLEEAMKTLREKLPKDAVLVGQNIRKDVEWLQLKEVWP